jgi:hypothetical protein
MDASADRHETDSAVDHRFWRPRSVVMLCGARYVLPKPPFLSS